MAKVQSGFAGSIVSGSRSVGRHPQFLPLDQKLSIAAELATALRQVGHVPTDPKEVPVYPFLLSEVPASILERARAEGLASPLLTLVRVGVSVFDTISSTNGLASLCWQAKEALVVVGKDGAAFSYTKRSDYYIPTGKTLKESPAPAIEAWMAQEHGGIDATKTMLQIALLGFRSGNKEIGAWDPDKVGQFAMFQDQDRAITQKKHRKAVWEIGVAKK